ncbi:tektin-1-like isoform X2 [Littorina saxatilis]|uniref:tektin-1-like isoform X2 n=1 Tax=Littorina saxatilis TaxID=31220 RepID=UPI0038B52796
MSSHRASDVPVPRKPARWRALLPLCHVTCFRITADVDPVRGETSVYLFPSMNSTQLRSNIDGILQSTSNDRRKQVDATALAFSKRIHETRDTKGKLEDHLNKILGQIKEIEENISRLKKGIADKEAALELALTRLDTRRGRPNVELCRDAVQYRLVEEVHELEDSLAQLQSRLADTMNSLKGLTRNQLDVEDDIETKNNTLFIDEVECMAMRKSINIQQF